MMNLHTNLLSKTLSTVVLLMLLVTVTTLVSCSADPEPVNEEEVITTVRITLTREGGTPTVLEWDDVNFDGVVDAGEIEPVALYTNTAYTATIELLNKSVEPVEDITEEIREEAEDHLFCFEANGVNITFSNFDKDANERNVGLISTWTTTTIGAGSVNIKLRHQPGTKTGTCTGGETDIDLSFPISVVAKPV